MSEDNGNSNNGRVATVRQTLEILKPPILPLVCGKCGTRMPIHVPRIVKQVDFFVSTLVIAPSWSLDERVCPGCGTAYAPAIEGLPRIGWIPVEIPAAEEKSRIIKPDFGLPPNFNPRG